MTTGRDDEAYLLSGSYALDALSDEERVAFEAELAQSEELRAEAAGLSDTAALLGAASEPITPPAALKDSIMSRIGGLPQQAPLTIDEAAVEETTAEVPAAPSVATAAAPVAEVTSVPQPAPPGPAELRAHRRWYSRPVTLITSAAAALLLIAGTIVGVNWIGPTGWGQQRQLEQITAAADSQSATVPVTGGGEATLVWSNELGQSALMVDGVAQLDSNKTYELWYINDSGITSAGTFGVGSDGSTWRVLKGTMQAGDTVGVTVEPRGGSDQPTTDPIVVVSSA